MRRGFVGVLVALCLAVVVVTLPSTPAPAASDTWRPPAGASFNIPRSGERAWTNDQRILAAIRHAGPRSVIRIATYSLDRIKIADALVAAHRRGARVQVLLNNHQWTRAMARLRRNLGSDRTKSSFSYTCSYGCRAAGENMHTKYYLFSRTGAASWVSMTGSHNLTANASKNQWNDLYTVRGNRALWDGLTDLFLQLKRDRTASPLYYWKNVAPRFQYQVLPYPNFSATNDPVMTILRRVRCFGATGGTGSNGRTVVRVNMAVFNHYRGEYLARKVRRLYADGCDVRVLYGAATRRIREVFATRTRRGYVPVHVSGYDTNYDGTMDLYGHEKALIVSGRYRRNTATSFVWTSSGNWTTNGIRGDELIFRIKGPGANRAYRGHFAYMWRNGSHLAGYIPYGNRRAAYTPAEAPQPALRGPAWEND